MLQHKQSLLFVHLLMPRLPNLAGYDSLQPTDYSLPSPLLLVALFKQTNILKQVAVARFISTPNNPTPEMSDHANPHDREQ
jgi:hypothetical protein